MVGKQKKVSGFTGELKELMHRHGVDAFVSCVCRSDDKEHGTHRFILLGSRNHCKEIMEDMQDIFTEIGIGQQQKEKDEQGNSFIYA